MSRIGKKPIVIPKGVTIKADATGVDVKGPKGQMKQALPPGVSAAVEDGTIVTKKISDDAQLDKFHGLARSLVNNAVLGVTEGWKRELDIVGVGYRAELKGQQITLALGYSHPVVFEVPKGIEVAIEKQTHITVTGVDRQLVGQVAANLRRLRKPDPYQQKGVRYTGEVLKKEDGSVVMRIKTKEDRRDRIKFRIRKKMNGTAAKPRLSVFRSVSHIYVQVIDDMNGQTIASASTIDPKVKGGMAKGVAGGNIKGAEFVGKAIAERLKEKGITKVVFDRNGFLYHGRVRAVAEAARSAGLEF